MIWLSRCISLVAQTFGNHFIIFPPQQRMLASHPTYSLLGFSAVLALIFTPQGPRNGRSIWNAPQNRMCVFGLRMQFLTKGIGRQTLLYS